MRLAERCAWLPAVLAAASAHLAQGQPVHAAELSLLVRASNRASGPRKALGPLARFLLLNARRLTWCCVPQGAGPRGGHRRAGASGGRCGPAGAAAAARRRAQRHVGRVARALPEHRLGQLCQPGGGAHGVGQRAPAQQAAPHLAAPHGKGRRPPSLCRQSKAVTQDATGPAPPPLSHALAVAALQAVDAGAAARGAGPARPRPAARRGRRSGAAAGGRGRERCCAARARGAQNGGGPGRRRPGPAAQAPARHGGAGERAAAHEARSASLWASMVAME